MNLILENWNQEGKRMWMEDFKQGNSKNTTGTTYLGKIFIIDHCYCSSNEPIAKETGDDSETGKVQWERAWGKERNWAKRLSGKIRPQTYLKKTLSLVLWCWESKRFKEYDRAREMIKNRYGRNGKKVRKRWFKWLKSLIHMFEMLHMFEVIFCTSFLLTKTVWCNYFPYSFNIDSFLVHHKVTEVKNSKW